MLFLHFDIAKMMSIMTTSESAKYYMGCLKTRRYEAKMMQKVSKASNARCSLVDYFSNLSTFTAHKHMAVSLTTSKQSFQFRHIPTFRCDDLFWEEEKIGIIALGTTGARCSSFLLQKHVHVSSPLSSGSGW